MCGGGWDPQIYYDPISLELGRCCLLRTLLSTDADPASDQHNQLRPDLAASLPQISPDGLTWTFTIRSGIHYGPPLASAIVTSQDFVRSIERAMSPRPVNQSEGWGPVLSAYTVEYLNLGGIIEGGQEYVEGTAAHVSGLETPDNRTLVVHLAIPTGTLGYVLAFPDFAPIPPNPADPAARFGIATDLPRLYGRYLASTGPYMVEGSAAIDYSVPPVERAQPSGDAGATYTLVRNPSWDAATDPLRAAYADRIIISRVATEDDAVRLLETGAIDVFLQWSPGADLIRRMDATSVDIRQQSLDALRYLGLNVAVPPLDDLHVRRAIAFAIDRPAVVRAFIAAGIPGAVATHVGLDSEEDNLLLNYDGSSLRTGPNLAAARDELRRSAYDTDGDGRCDQAACHDIRLLAQAVTFDGSPGPADAADVIARNLRPLGLDVRPWLVDPETFDAYYANPPESVAMRIDGWFKDSSTGSTWFPPLFQSSRLHVTGGGNFYSVGASPQELRKAGYDVTSVPNVDDRLRTCLGLAFDAQVQCWAEFDRYVTENVVSMVPLEVETRAVVLSNSVTRFAMDTPASAPEVALDRIAVRPGAPPSPSLDPGPLPEIPNGRYRMTVTRADLEQAGAPTDNVYDVQNSTGTFVLSLRDGVWYWTQFARHPVSGPLTVAGTYSGSGETARFSFLANSDNAGPHPTLRWAPEGDGFTFEMQNCGSKDGVFCAFIDAQFTSHPWMSVD